MIAKEFKSLRERTGLSQTAFAMKFHIPRGVYQHWEQGVYTPPSYILWMMKNIIFAEEKGFDIEE